MINVEQRTLAIEGMINFRDMGGYHTKQGQQVRWGRLYRSDHLYNATAKGLEAIKALHIKRIIDYRSPDEISKYPNPILPAETIIYELDPSAHTAELSAQFSSSKSDEDANLIQTLLQKKAREGLENHDEIVLRQYENFVTGHHAKHAFSRMLHITASEAEGPILQHCRGGKDRTGFGAMLLLGVLGVQRDDLIADYMLTESNRRQRNAIKMAGYRELTDDPEVLAYLHAFIDTKPDFIEKSICTIEKNYGSIEEYSIRELGLTDVAIQRLKARYLLH